MFSLSDLVGYLSPTQESANQFVGRAFADDLPRVFGGQVLAQALVRGVWHQWYWDREA